MQTDNETLNIQAYSSELRTYTVPEIAALLRISRSKAYALCNTEPFRIIRIGRCVRIPKLSFDEWLDQQK